MKHSKFLAKVLVSQSSLYFEAMENGDDLVGALGDNELMRKALEDQYLDVGYKSYKGMIIEQRNENDHETRATKSEITEQLLSILATEAIILNEIALIDAFTVSKITELIIEGQVENKTIAEIQRGILDSGTFSPERALRIARTVSGTAQSVGQLSAASDSGAINKEWVRGSADSRAKHTARHGEIVGINDRFSKQYSKGLAPRYPLDQQTSASDRVNCTCSLTFS